MKYTAFVVALASMVGFSMLAGCAKEADKKAPDQQKLAVKPAVLSTLQFPAAGAAAPVGEAQFVMKWLTFGPFTFGENDFGGDQQQASIDKEFMPNEGALDGSQQPPASSKAAWKVNDFRGAETAGMVDLDPLYNAIDHAAAYAVVWVNCPEDARDLKLLVGSDDYVKVWINGKLVHTFKKERRAGLADQDAIADITLKKGVNRVVVKCVDVVMGWNFYLRFATKDGKAIGIKAE